MMSISQYITFKLSFARVRLSKRRLKAGQQPSNSKLVVRHRPLNKQEHRMQRYREKNLEPHGKNSWIPLNTFAIVDLELSFSVECETAR
jgi:Paf1